jgi:hypothetical protein
MTWHIFYQHEQVCACTPYDSDVPDILAEHPDFRQEDHEFELEYMEDDEGRYLGIWCRQHVLPQVFAAAICYEYSLALTEIEPAAIRHTYMRHVPRKEYDAQGKPYWQSSWWFCAQGHGAMPITLWEDR